MIIHTELIRRKEEEECNSKATRVVLRNAGVECSKD